MTRRLRTFIRRLARALTLLARDRHIPAPLRWIVAVGLLPIPGPLDEALLLVAGLLVWTFYRARLRSAWDGANPRAEAAADAERATPTR